jgi:hypothetical protein
MNKFLQDPLEELMLRLALEVKSRKSEIDELEEAADRVDLMREIVKSYLEETK